MPTEMWDEMMRTNLRSAFLCTRAVLPGMLSQGDGRIIYVASQLALKGAPDLVHYSAAKAAIIGMTRALAREVAPNVTVNAIAPGPIETDMLANITAEWKAMKTGGAASGAIRPGERRRADRRLPGIGRRLPTTRVRCSVRTGAMSCRSRRLSWQRCLLLRSIGLIPGLTCFSAIGMMHRLAINDAFRWDATQGRSPPS